MSNDQMTKVQDEDLCADFSHREGQTFELQGTSWQERCHPSGDWRKTFRADERAQRCVVTVKRGNLGWVLDMMEGGSTGFEGFYMVTDRDSGWDLLHRAAEQSARGWTACAGTVNSWRELHIPGSEMAKLWAWLSDPKAINDE